MTLSIFSPDMAARIQPFQSTEKTRYYLNGFALQAFQGGTVMVATDGYVLGAFNDPNGHCAADCIVQLPKDFIRAAKKRSGYKMAVYLDHDTETAYLAAADVVSNLPDDLTQLPGLDCIAPKVIVDGTFPNWRRVIPDIGAGQPTTHAVAAFNSKLLARFSNVATDKGGAHITIYSESDSSAAVVRVAGVPEFFGVAMPMRDKTIGLPDWFLLDCNQADQIKKAA
jgi:hypothetical protein